MTWRKLADEGGSADVPADSTVRYGAGPEDRFIERVVSGVVEATNAFFGADPARGTLKGLWLLVVEQPAPPPEPPPEPVAPTMPAADDPLFAEKARIYEAWQRDKSMALKQAEIDAINANAQASRDLLAALAGMPIRG